MHNSVFAIVIVGAGERERQTDCVCVCERERERERVGWCEYKKTCEQVCLHAREGASHDILKRNRGNSRSK